MVDIFPIKMLIKGFISTEYITLFTTFDLSTSYWDSAVQNKIARFSD